MLFSEFLMRVMRRPAKVGCLTGASFELLVFFV
uniref:Uncharacterized protein n=1 Tax=Arundo donax TaxID=35708 RepID=A0A0A9GPY8_ARUDO